MFLLPKGNYPCFGNTLYGNPVIPSANKAVTLALKRRKIN